HFNPIASAAPTYAAANLFLYKELTGDSNANGTIDAGETARKYAANFFNARRFDAKYKTTGTISYFTDAWGYPFGYSTAGLKAEQNYRAILMVNPTAARPAPAAGYNSTFDLWSTAGSTTTTSVSWTRNW